MILSLSEIVRKAQKLETDEQKIEWLQRNDSIPLRQLLICNYDKERIKFLIPDTPPPYKPSVFHDSHGMLYRQIRKLQYVIAGEVEMNITQYKRERLFIEMLESIDPGDAELLCEVIQQKPLTGLSALVINKAFGDILPKSLEAVETKAETKPKSAKKAKQDVA